MKRLFTRLLTLVLSLTWLTQTTNATEYNYSVMAASDWGQTFTSTRLTGSQAYFSAAVSNNWMYSAPAPQSASDMMVYNYSDPDYASRIFRLLTAEEVFTFPTTQNYFPYPGFKGGSSIFSGYFYMGPAHAADTKGNLYFAHYSVDASAYSYVWADPIGAITAFSVDNRPYANVSESALGGTYQSNASPTAIILDPTYNGTVSSSATNMRISYRSDVMSAYGDGLGSTGYLWFAPNNGAYNNNVESYTKIERITLNKGVAKSKDIFDAPEVNTTRSRVVQYADNKLLYNNQATGKLYKGTISGSSITWTDLGLINQGTGATMFMLAGREMLAYSSTTTAFQIVDVTDVNNKQVIGTYTPFTTASGNTYTRGHFINVTNIDDYNASIYIFVPKRGTEKYTITATPIDSPDPEPTESIFEVKTTPEKKISTIIANGTVYSKQMAVANGVTYVPYASMSKIHFANMVDGTSDDITVGAGAGWGIASDDARNLVTAFGMSYTAKITKVRVYKSTGYGTVISSTSSFKDYDLSSVYTTMLTGNSNKGRTDFWAASGNCYDGNGALWFTDGITVVKIPIENGVQKAEVTYKMPSNMTSVSGQQPTQTLIDPYSENEYILMHGTGLYDCKINADKSITATKLSDIYYYSSDIAYLQGHKFLVRPNSSSIDGKIVVEDLTAQTSTTIDVGKHNLELRVNAWCEFETIDDYTLGLYVYVPSGNTYKYLITATPVVSPNPVQNLSVTIVRDQDPNEPTRQDAIVTWEAPEGGAVESYDVYYRTRYTRIGKDTETVNTWNYQGNTTELTMTDVDVRYYQTNGETVKRYYDYKVIPNYVGGIKGEESEIVTVAPDFIPFTPIWDTEKDQDDKKYGIDRYDGYCKVQLYWKFPQKNNPNGGYLSRWGCRPDYYSILRNGQEIVANITAFNYIDQTVKPGQTYVYNVVAHYYSMPETAISSDNEVRIDARDWSKIGYVLSEVYNYPIKAEGDSVVVPQDGYLNFATRNSNYRQGVFYDGHWYISQLKDNDDDAVATAGGIYRIPAAASWEGTENLLNPNSFKKIYTNAASQSCGVAIDEGGNIFTAIGTKTTAGADSKLFTNRLVKGLILMNDGDGINYTNRYEVDLSGINFAEYSPAGRMDFFSMKGNLTGGTASAPSKAYLYLSPNTSRAVYVIELSFNGTTVTAATHYVHEDTAISSFTKEPFQPGANNYVFPVKCAGRDNEFIHNLRSSAYSLHACHSADGNNYTTIGRKGTVYDTQSRVNNSGGCAIEWNGELFVITPQSQFTSNSGNFYVGMGYRSSNSVSPTNADLTRIFPADMWAQDDKDANINTNSSGVWLEAEKATDASGKIIDENNDGEADYLFIYMYVPGARFAKYKLTPSSLFPPSQVYLSIDKKYAREYDGTENNPGGDIVRFDATATWPEVTDYGTTGSVGHSAYKIEGYTAQLLNDAGEEISSYTFNLAEVTLNEDGTITNNADESILANISWDKRDIVNADQSTSYDVTCFTYVFADVEKDEPYVAQVTVNYLGIDTHTVGKSQQSPKTEWQDVETYVCEAPEGNVLVKDYKNRWGDWDNLNYGNPAKGEFDEDDIYYDDYQIFLDVANPEFEGRVEPVTYYTLSVDTDNDGEVDKNIEKFYLYVPKDAPATYSVRSTSSTEEYVEVADGKIPGSYNFNEVPDQTPVIHWSERDYTAGAVTDEVDYSECGPSQWTYYVTANYAAYNEKIAEQATSKMVATTDGITTGVEVISTTTVLNVYPIPATINVTIKCSEAIEKIEVYSTSGVLVKSIEGDGQQVATVNVSDLAAGYYFLQVNALNPVKIIKN